MTRDKRICSFLSNITSLFVSASSMAMDESYATSLSENEAMIGHSLLAQPHNTPLLPPKNFA